MKSKKSKRNLKTTLTAIALVVAVITANSLLNRGSRVMRMGQYVATQVTR